MPDSSGSSKSSKAPSKSAGKSSGRRAIQIDPVSPIVTEVFGEDDVVEVKPIVGAFGKPLGKSFGKSFGKSSRRPIAVPAAHSPDAAARPGFIVLFREKSARNVSKLSAVLGVGESKRRARAGFAETASGGVGIRLASPHEGAAEPLVLERLGLAALDLTTDEHEKLTRDDSVRVIVPNRVRHLPAIRNIAEGADAEITADGDPMDLIPAALMPPESLPDSPQLAYMMGLRDALNLAINAQLAGATPAAASASILSRRAHSWCLDMIGLGAGYTRATGRGVKVAVLDTGADLDHPDLRSQILLSSSFIKDEPDADDAQGHGTHCAGVIAAVAKSVGGRRYSVAPDAQLLIGKVLNKDGDGSDDEILAGIEWAADNGARIISMSLGSERAENDPFDDLYETLASDLLAEDPGVLFIAAAGNESDRPNKKLAPVGNPAACPSILAVSALDRNRRVYDYGCAHTDAIGALDLCAPGVNVYSAWKAGRFARISGTSMATPHVAGVAALLLEANPKLRAKDLWSMLSAAAQPIDPPRDFGRGLVRVPV
jgi:subtilisin